MGTEHGSQLVGERIGNYQLLRLLGSGGFADVYLGEHQHLGNYAAIKVLHTRLTNEQIEGFRQEGRILAHLLHPHIVRVLDFDVQNMRPFLVMSYAPGGTLRQRHSRGSRVPLARVVGYAQQVASALDYAHAQKLIHCDVKPENMLIDQQGNIILSDFGVASMAHDTRSQTLATIAGTIAYIAPEQIQGRPRTASDQYALSAIVYEWLSGERPFRGSVSEVVSQHLVMPPPPLSERLPDIPPAVEKVIFTALAKDPHQRYASVGDFAAALAQASLESSTDELDEVTAPRAAVARPRSATTRKIESNVEATQDIHAQQSTPSTSPSLMSAARQQPRHRWPIIAGSLLLAILLIVGGIAAFARPTVMSKTTTARHTPVAQLHPTATLTPAQRSAAIASAGPNQLYHLVTSVPPTWQDPLKAQDRNNWTISQHCGFSNGTYRVTSTAAQALEVCFANNTYFCNMAFQIQITHLSSEGGGIDFRAGSRGSKRWGYTFMLKPEGAYDLLASGVSVIPYTHVSSPAVHTGYHVSNTITVIARGSDFYFYANRHFLVSAHNSTLTCGKIGLIALEGSNTPAAASFSNARVWTLPSP
ncbi:serine/threonine protein kinase [Dictyobacter aurantiacus]|uniref:non-specific serine/threonine protein kinase n=1 Tax=Dictyobacter aurantiacus TaxID=1936993 RepID=A0A401ZG12_9CHLR|nr:serine/threonine-protein kinase [Dictyobacter aurantiacus]GCE05743.1 hypothetical protein KDAU_30720 [Dictyobacter aurantiacus]